MTDNEIIKVAELCCEYNPQCERCPLNDYDTCDECMGELLSMCLDLINRQKEEIAKKDIEIDVLIRKKETLSDEVFNLRAEVEMLEKEVDRLSQCVLYHDGHIADAIKEFADMVFELFPEDKQFTTISRFAIKHILKDLTENK